METTLVLGIVGVAGAIMGQRAWRAARKLTEQLARRRVDVIPGIVEREVTGLDRESF